MWESPIYRFRIPKDENEESSDWQEVVIDVTGSAPPFKEPSDTLKEVLKEVFSSDSFERIDTVLEFGAAKLKNIPYILKQGKTVCAVDFEELTKNAFTKRNLRACRRYGTHFQEMIFPRPFITDSKKFDLVLLANVIPVMPVLAERLYLLDLLHNKVKSGKYLLWVAQKEGSYKKIRENGKNNCGDGIWMGQGRYFKTFYKYHRVEDLDEMMALYGFKMIKRFGVGDDARLYQKTEHNLFSNLITPNKIDECVPVDSTIKDLENADKLRVVRRNSSLKAILPNPKPLLIESLYTEKLMAIPPGQENAEMYHRVVSHAIARIFRGSLRNMEIKVSIDGGVKIIDTLFTNEAERGFFHSLKAKFSHTYPIMEMKNISVDPTNTEFDQLNGRLNDNRGHFGIMVCRKIENESRAYSKCKTFLPNNCVLFLTDKDIFELLEYARENNQSEINDFMDRKLRALLF